MTIYGRGGGILGTMNLSLTLLNICPSPHNYLATPGFCILWSGGLYLMLMMTTTITKRSQHWQVLFFAFWALFFHEDLLFKLAGHMTCESFRFYTVKLNL